MSQPFARVDNNVVVEMITIPDGHAIGDCFHADLAATMHPCDASVTLGWTFNPSTGAFSAPVPAPLSKARLLAYAQQVQSARLSAGISVNVAPAGSPAVNVLCDGSSATRADLALLALFGQANPTGQKTWIDDNGLATVLTGAELLTLVGLIGTWIAATYGDLATISGGINAGAISTYAQIDAANWS